MEIESLGTQTWELELCIIPGRLETCQGHAAHKAVVTQEADQSKPNLQDSHRGLARILDCSAGIHIYPLLLCGESL